MFSNSLKVLLLILIVHMRDETIAEEQHDSSTHRPEKDTNTKQGIESMLTNQAEMLENYKNKFITNVKSVYIVEPTELETKDADEAMDYVFSIGSDKLLDTSEKLEYFCREKDNLLIEISAWVIRKYTFNINVRLLVSLILSRMKRKNELYCADNNFKQSYLKFSEQLTQLNPILTAIRYKFIDTLAAIQQSHIGINKGGQICCAYWRYKRETLDTIGDNLMDLKLFVSDMLETYFGGGLNYLCFMYSEGSSSCSSYQNDPPVPHTRESLLMNLILAVNKIVNIVL